MEETKPVPTPSDSETQLTNRSQLESSRNLLIENSERASTFGGDDMVLNSNKKKIKDKTRNIRETFGAKSNSPVFAGLQFNL